MNINKIDGWGETPKDLFEELVGKYVGADTISYDVLVDDDIWTLYLVRRPEGAPEGPVFNNEAMEGILWIRNVPADPNDLAQTLEQVATPTE